MNESVFFDWVGSEEQLADFVLRLSLSDQRPFFMKVSGEMGMGKSRLVRQILADTFQIHVDSGSPSFPVVNTYSIGDAELFHVDAYRLNEDEEWFDSGILEDLLVPSGFVMVEWLEKFPKIEERIRRVIRAQGRDWIEVGITAHEQGRRYRVQVWRARSSGD